MGKFPKHTTASTGVIKRVRQKVTIPRKSYILFELIKIDKLKYRSNDPAAFTQEDVIHLAVLPENLNYSKTSRDYVMQGAEDFFVTKYSPAAEKCSLNGYFGDTRRLVAGTYMTGWDRLIQFQDTIFEKSKLLTANEMYVVNYYDFLMQKFGVINLNNWNLSGSARTNTNMPRYSTEFVLLGDLIKPTVESQTDQLLNLLIEYYLPGTSFFALKTKEIENWYNKEILSTAQTIQTWYEGYSLALEEASNITTEITKGVNAIKGMGSNLGGTINDITKLDQIKGIYSQGISIFN